MAEAVRFPEGFARLLAERSGRVEQYLSSTGLGEVSDESGLRYPFHCTAIANGTREIPDGQPVRFVLRTARGGRLEADAITNR